MKLLTNFMLPMLLLVTGCGKVPEKNISVAPEELRILSLVTAADHIIAELGAADKIAAIDRHGRVLESMKNVPVTAAGGMVSREMLRQYSINCAIVWYYQRDLAEQLLAKENIKLLVVEPLNGKNYRELVHKLGSLCGKTAAVEPLLKKLDTAVSSRQGRAPVKVYFELYAPWKTPSADGFIAELIKRAGGVLALKGTRRGTVSPEAAALSQMEVIFFVENFGSVEEISGRAALRRTPAVKNKKIYAVPRKLVCEGVAPEELIKFISDKIKDI